MCDCQFTPDPNDPDENTPDTAWHYKRTCAACGVEWFGLHCPHDLRQNPCPHCGKVPTPEPDLKSKDTPSRAKH